MQKHVNLVDLVKSFPTNIYLQNLASIQKRTNPVKFAHLAEKSGKGSISNLSTKVTRARNVAAHEGRPLHVRPVSRSDRNEAYFGLASPDYTQIVEARCRSVSTPDLARETLKPMLQNYM